MKNALKWMLALALAAHGLAGESLVKNFEQPPADYAPGVFWYWLNGRVTAEGIDADLEAMKEAGIHEVRLFNVAHFFSRPSTALQPVRVLSPEWRTLMKQALKKADELGMRVNLYNSMEGWSSTGGPAITPELAMQRVTWSRLQLQGGKRFQGKLPMPRFGFDHYREIAVLAFPTPESELAQAIPVITSDVPGFDPSKLSNDPIPSIGFSSYCYDFKQSRAELALLPAAKGKQRHITLSYDRPFAARSFRLYPAYSTPWIADTLATGELQRSDDGTGWATVQSFTLSGYTPLDINFTAEPARYWRVVLSGERELPLDELKLSASYRIGNWTSKSFFSFRHLMEYSEIEYYDTPAPASEIIQKESIINLTSKMNAKGELDWEVPPGNWTVLRFGHTPTGSVVRPAGAGAQGLENDKLSKESLEVHWAQAIQPWLDDPETRELFDTVHIDSFEAGSQNWTPKMLEAFNARNGYDMTPYLPVMIGRVVDSDLDSERFLWDLRTTICDMITDNYFVHFRDLCHAAGKQSSLEAYGDNGTLNVVAAAKTADLPMVENGGYYYTKMASSPAHLYGKKVITTESFTASPAQGSDWSSAFWDLKPWGDSFFAAGANHIGYHVYTAQPFDDSVRPGLTLGTWGTHFHRTHTWWKEMPAFSTYLARSSYLLQQGHFVGDVLFFYGEGAPKNYSFPKLHGDSIYALPRGYDCDFGDLDVLLTRITVKDGMLTTPDGIAYKILVVPNESDAMTPQLVKRIGELVKAGATVMAPKPKLSPSLRSQPQADAYIRKMADEIWGDCDGVQATEHAYGKGKIVWGDSLAAVLAQEGMEPAVISPVLTGVHQNDHGTTRGHWKWIQRQLPEGDLFFVMNGTDKQETVEFSFRTEGTSPQWFDAVTGQTRMLPEFKNSDGRVSLDLGFAPRQSGFVFFANQPKPASGQNIQQLDTLKAIEGAWTVSFDPKWGGPARTTFPTLTDWSQHADEGIKYYSGRATYTKTFTMPNGVKGERYFLDLGTVKNLANVSLNGRRLGTVWCAPWQIEIEPQVGENVVEIEVVNLWVNRLIGDMKFDPDGVERHAGGTAKRLPAWLDGSVPRSEKRYTFSLYNPWKADSPLQPSGLLGPVSIKVIESHGHQ